ncbi:DNA internalization-related competence protein ComEC/Rec2 [Paucisalibacillus globulus]|uniref:DNA internalization-related competence protein ComEC/Rec2 n=1 Tax=Paucisalibacillus globulus TaxID=351095 RepID=UPI00040B195E|nr:DNA internalization-related competence protein ComEC/Rec2 [Paucisalibacillus globulus]
MKGYWHFPAFAGLCGAITVIFDSFIFFIVLLFWLVILYKTKRLGKIPIIFSLATFLLFFLYIPQIKPHTSVNSQEKMILTGEIVSHVQPSETFLQFDFQESKTKSILKVLYYSPDSNHQNYSSIQLGASCQIEGEVGDPEESTNPGQFNYRKYLAASGIDYEMEIDSIDDIACHGKTTQGLLYTLRENIIHYISTTYSEETSAWINALILGDDSQINENTIELFQRWGLSHLLAISGSNIGLVVILFYFITVKLNLFTKEKAQYLLMVFLPIYAILAGGEPSVLRASLMVLLLLLMQKIKLNLSVTDVISVAFLILIVLDKYIIYQVGFQLSFIVTFGIIISGKWLLEESSLFFQMLKISFISQLIIIPLQIIYFFNFNPLSIIINVFVVPYFSFFVMPFMFILLVLSPIAIVRDLLDTLYATLHDILLLTPLEYIDQFAYFPWVTGVFPPLLIVIYYVLLIAMMMRIQKNKHWKAFIHGLMLVVVLFLLVIRPFLSPFGTVTMLDIGQGDAIVIEFPYRMGVVIVDAGANFTFENLEPTDSNYKRILRPFLQYQGINKIDAVFVSHEDVDHAGSVNYILKDYEVKQIIVSKYYNFEGKLLGDLENKGTGILQVEAGQSIEINGTMFNILSPWVDKKSSNENSLVLLTELGNMSWLFTGDIHQDNEKEILQRYPNLTVDVLKVAHHGSNTSTDPVFINQTNPSFALISVGRENRYGHPSLEVIELLKEEKTTIMRTDQNGAIIYRYTEKGGTFYPYKP